MDRNIGVQIASKMGKLVHIDLGLLGLCLGWYLRVRICLDAFASILYLVTFCVNKNDCPISLLLAY